MLENNIPKNVENRMEETTEYFIAFPLSWSLAIGNGSYLVAYPHHSCMLGHGWVDHAYHLYIDDWKQKSHQLGYWGIYIRCMVEARHIHAGDLNNDEDEELGE